jgi:hypothetical protein
MVPGAGIIFKKDPGMKSIDKLPWLALLESKTEQHITDAVALFQNMEEHLLNKPSPSGGWSIAQCLAHLNTYGDYYLPRLQTGLKIESKMEDSETYKSSWLGAYLIKLTDPQTSRMKLKAVKRHQPMTDFSAHQTVADFIDQQETMFALLRMAHQADVNQFRIPMSIASWVSLPLGDILHFMVAHTERHMMQAKRNIEYYRI